MAAGFSRADVFDMTLAQVRAYSAAVERARRRDLREAVVAALAGARYDEKGLKRLFKELEK